MKQLAFSLFRGLAKWFSGHALRGKYPFINRLYVAANQGLSPREVVVHGAVMFLDPGDSMGLALQGDYERLETQAVIENVKSGQHVLDIGANIGYFTMLFAQLVGPDGKVTAFEPDSTSFALLKKNVEANGFRQVDLRNVAVSNAKGELALYRDPFNNLDHSIVTHDKARASAKVSVVRLDDMLGELKQPIHFIKLDIQGAEGLALEGMRELLVRNPGVRLMLEFWPEGLRDSGIGADVLLQRLEGLGFGIRDLGREGEAQGTASGPEILARYAAKPGEHTNLLCVRP